MREHVIPTNSGGSLIGKISSYLQIVDKDPHSTAFVPLAEAYRQIGLLDDALEVARFGTRMLPHFSPGFATLGRILSQMGRIEEAKAAYSESLNIDCEGLSALVGLTRLHLARGERDAARQILLMAAKYHPQDETIANILVALDLPRPAFRLTPEPVASPRPDAQPAAPVEEEIPGGPPIPTATLAEIYLKQGLVDQALQVYREILCLDPSNAVARRRLSELSPATASAVTLPAGEAVRGGMPPVRPAKSPQILTILESWLRAVQQRKSHV